MPAAPGVSWSSPAHPPGSLLPPGLCPRPGFNVSSEKPSLATCLGPSVTSPHHPNTAPSSRDSHRPPVQRVAAEPKGQAQPDYVPSAGTQHTTRHPGNQQARGTGATTPQPRPRAPSAPTREPRPRAPSAPTREPRPGMARATNAAHGSSLLGVAATVSALTQARSQPALSPPPYTQGCRLSGAGVTATHSAIPPLAHGAVPRGSARYCCMILLL